VPEKVIVRHNMRYETEFQIPDPEHPESGEFLSIAHIHALTPYGMMLASAGTCTTILLHSYAQNHSMALDEVEIALEYRRDFDRDCEDCEVTDRYEEQITQEIRLTGELDRKERRKLFAIAHQCPIEKILKNGIHIQSDLVEAS
jgi:uncharacterized OsmC-like protein